MYWIHYLYSLGFTLPSLSYNLYVILLKRVRITNLLSVRILPPK